MSARRTIGGARPRRDAVDKVLGRTRFAADVRVPGLLHLAVARSDTAHARVRAVHTARARAVPGVVGVFTARHVPGENRYGIIASTADQPMLAGDRVRFVGEAVALVAAETPEAAAEGASRVVVDYDPLPAITDPSEALEAGAVAIHDRGNLCFEQRIVRGDVDAGFARAAAVVERTYRTAVIEHAYLEPEAALARIEDGVLVVETSTQNPHYDRSDLCRLLGLAEDRVRVVQRATGGGFGGKLDLSVQPYVALATWLTGRPSRLVYSREESFLASGKRHPFVMRYRSAADGSGRLVAVEADLVADTGAYASYALAVAMRAAVHAAGPYRVPAVRIRCRTVYTNRVFSGAMRGFGTPQAAFGHESQMDLLAGALGIDPLELRRRNALRPGDVTVTGQTLGHSVGLVACLDRVGAVRDRWARQLREPGTVPRGLGVGAMYYGIGNTGVSNPSSARVALDPDGAFTLFTGAADIGQGSDNALLAICAETLGVDPDRIRLVRGDTARTANAGATSASRQTYISGGAVLRAAGRLRERLVREAARVLGVPADRLVVGDGRVGPAGGTGASVTLAELAARCGGGPVSETGGFDPDAAVLDRTTGQGRPYGTYAFAAQVARVSVDPATAEVRVDGLAAAHDVGRAIHRPSVLGQISGGVAMGLGMALMETFGPGRDENLDTYLVPTTLDVPRVTPMIVEQPEPTGPFGAKGVGEPALIPTAPAILNALAAACGARIHNLPATLERVQKALRGEEA